MTSLYSLNPEKSFLTIQTNERLAPKAIISQRYKELIYKDLANASLSTVIWGGLSYVGEVARAYGGGINTYLSDYKARAILIDNQAEPLLKDLKLFPLLEHVESLKHIRVAAEFMLATHLSHMALRSLGFKPSALTASVSVVSGLAVIILIESSSDFVASYNDFIHREIFTKVIITPVLGAIVSASIFSVLSAGFSLCSTLLPEHGDESPTEKSEIQTSEIAALAGEYKPIDKPDLNAAAKNSKSTKVEIATFENVESLSSEAQSPATTDLKSK
ncbi:MAG TPA: hypothetical protein VGP47_05090 [Parachlamydiaceae bacterium]|nr:hypothetical protein [Parachlamydiaceae bacterium]